MSGNDFYEDLGYQLPDSVPEGIASESFEYFKQPVGIYRGLFGKLVAKYKDINGNRCEETADTAKLSHFINNLWVTEYLGTPASPVHKPILSVGQDMIHIPAGIGQVAELYFPLVISLDPKMQWSIQGKFESFMIQGHEELRIVKVNPAKMTEKITNFRAFPAYYGMQIEFILNDVKKDGTKTSPYLASIKLINADKVAPELMNRLESDYLDLLKAEQDARKSKQGESFDAPPPPKSDFSDIENDYQ